MVYYREPVFYCLIWKDSDTFSLGRIFISRPSYFCDVQFYSLRLVYFILVLSYGTYSRPYPFILRHGLHGSLLWIPEVLCEGSLLWTWTLIFLSTASSLPVHFRCEPCSSYSVSSKMIYEETPYQVLVNFPKVHQSGTLHQEL